VGTLILHLKARERLFINGAVVRPDRKTALEILNDVDFLLEAHVLQVEDATTPLRQLYVVAQTALMDPERAGPARELFATGVRDILRATRHPALHQALPPLVARMDAGKTFEVLKQLRGLFAIEREILTGAEDVVRPAEKMVGGRHG